MTTNPPARRIILVVDDHELVRIGMRTVIERRFGGAFTVVEAGTFEEALARLTAHGDDVAVLLLDLQLDDTRGLTGLHLARKLFPRLPVVIVSGSDDPRIRQEATLHGAIAYVTKGGAATAGPGLLEAIEAATTQAPPLPREEPDVARRTLSRASELRLSERQVQILELVLAGMDNRAIADETGLALGTVKNAVSSVFLAFNVRSRAELIALFAS